jgi:methylated-DNA-[protein]-cysteine S-methyltransferase
MKPHTFNYPTDLGYVTITWVDEPVFKVTKIRLPQPKISGSVSTRNERIMSLALHLGLAVKGIPIAFDLELFEFKNFSTFQCKVLMAEYNIPTGKVSTYSRIAEHIGHPGASRAVGTTLARNPFPLVIPCHRAVKANGDLGKYQGGTEMKRILLKREGVKFLSKTRVDLTGLYY